MIYMQHILLILRDVFSEVILSLAMKSSTYAVLRLVCIILFTTRDCRVSDSGTVSTLHPSLSSTAHVKDMRVSPIQLFFSTPDFLYHPLISCLLQFPVLDRELCLVP